MTKLQLDFWAVTLPYKDGAEIFAADPHIRDIHGHELYNFEHDYFGSYFGCGKCLFLDPFQATAFLENEKELYPDRDYSKARIVPVIVEIKQVSKEEFDLFTDQGSRGHYKWIVGIADDVLPINSDLVFGKFPSIKKAQSKRKTQ